MFINSALCQATTTPPPNPPKKDKFKDKFNSATCMQKLMYLVIGNRPFFGCELTVNQLKYGGEEVWNHLQIRYSVSISCFTRKLSFFSNLFFLLFSIVFFHQKHSGHFQCFCGIVSVLQFLCFLWVTWFWKQTSKQ